MPEWEIHNKWAKRVGIAAGVSDFVNLLIDFPQKCQEFLDFCDREPDARIYTKGRPGRPTHMTVASSIGHDSGRNKNYAREIQLSFLRRKGREYVKAWYLHHILDYIKWWVTEGTSEPTLSVEAILQVKRLERKFGSSQDQELQNVRDFAVEHSAEILQDCR